MLEFIGFACRAFVGVQTDFTHRFFEAGFVSVQVVGQGVNGFFNAVKRFRPRVRWWCDRLVTANCLVAYSN